MTTRLGPNEQAYNACIEALNGHEDAIERLLDERDRMWVAADAIASCSHGARSLPRNPIIKNGELRRK